MKKKKSAVATKQKMAQKQSLKVKKTQNRQELKMQKLKNKSRADANANKTKRAIASEVEKTKRTTARSAAFTAAASQSAKSIADANVELRKWNSIIAANANDNNTTSGDNNTTNYSNQSGNPVYGGNQSSLGGGK